MLCMLSVFNCLMPIRIEISLRQMMPYDSLKWHDNGFNERIVFILMHWTNRADNIELIAGILACKPITACQRQFTNVGFPVGSRIMITLFSLRMESHCLSFRMKRSSLTRTALIFMRPSLMFMT